MEAVQLNFYVIFWSFWGLEAVEDEATFLTNILLFTVEYDFKTRF